MTAVRTTILLEGKTATGALVPAEVVDALGGGKQPLVHVAIGDYRYRSKIGVRGGRAMVPISAERRADAAPGAQRAFAALSNSRKKALTLPIEGAKTPETRARRVAKAIETLTA